MKNIYYYILLIILFGCNSNNNNCAVITDCSFGNMTFNFQGTNLWDDDSGQFTTLDGNEIKICYSDLDYSNGSMIPAPFGCAGCDCCDNIFNVDLDNNSDGTKDLDIDIQYLCNSIDGGFYESGFLNINFNFKNIETYPLNQPIDITTLESPIFNYFRMTLGDGCEYNPLSGNITFTEINTQNYSIKATYNFSLEFLESSSLNSDCFPGFEGATVNGDINLTSHMFN